MPDTPYKKPSRSNGPPPRYAPDIHFPPYTYVPGQAPHPVTDPRGHAYGLEQPPPAALDPGDWRACREYLYGIDLFNHGYYWEAHETWERLWIAAGRTGLLADFLKGLIKLAAAGVKSREGNPEGVRRHLARARTLLRGICRDLTAGECVFCGLNVERLLQSCDGLPSCPAVDDARFGGAPVRALPVVLRLEAGL
jgi:hypothetical protein